MEMGRRCLLRRRGWGGLTRGGLNVRGRGSDYSGDKQALYGHENKYTHFSFANLLFVLRTEGLWPPVEEILVYQNQVRAKIEKLTSAKTIPRDVGRSLWIGFEHEIMHLETLLYMLLQSDKTLPPSKFKPDFEGMASLAEAAKVENDWFDIPEQRITLGLTDPEDNSGGDAHFGWDNEKPPRTVVVPAFQAQARPITNEDYARYLEQTHSSSIPASWAESTGNSSHANGHF